MDHFNYPTTVVVYSVDQHDKERLPDTLEGVLKWLQAHLESIPSEYRSKARFEIEASTYYDAPYATVSIEYERPATEQEITDRKAEAVREAERNVNYATQNIERERARLAELVAVTGE